MMSTGVRGNPAATKTAALLKKFCAICAIVGLGLVMVLSSVLAFKVVSPVVFFNGQLKPVE